MQPPRLLLALIVVALNLATAPALWSPYLIHGQAAADTPAYLNPELSVDARATDLVGRMTLDEKVSQVTNDAAGIPRLNVPAYDWWNECLHGVARAGPATVFPQAIGMAASFDTALMHDVATAISDEARAKHHEFVRRGQRGIYQGLTFWSPNINIFRDPRWGRGQETYGEDPFLTARMGVEFVKGLQGDDPRYLKVVATAKHYAVHSGPEADRHSFDVHPSERDLYETYLPAFRALVQEAKVASVMGAYNRINGESASGSPRFLQQILRRDWGFNGYVVSDCGAIDDIYKTHKIKDTREAAAALGISNGCDLECGTVYKSLRAAVTQGLVTEKELDIAVHRLMTARLRLGLFDPPERVKYAQIPYSVNQSPAHDQLSRRMAQASIVLLKNDGVLPLSTSVKSIAVIGPNADEVMTLLGNYYGSPAKPVTVLAGIRNAVAGFNQGTAVRYARGTDLVDGRADPRAFQPIESRYLRPAAPASSAAPQQGLRAEFFNGRELQGDVVLTRIDPTVSFRWDRTSPTADLVARGEMQASRALANDNFSARWSGQLLPPVSGRYELSVTADDGVRLIVDGKTLIDEWTTTPRAREKNVAIDLEGGKAYDVRLEYFESIRDAEIRFGWRLPGAKPPLEEALDAARASDVVVFVGGLNGDVEGEEMLVSYPGFAGGDRTDINLPASQDRLLRALQAAGKPIVLVLMSGSAIASEWTARELPAILEAWYPGQQGGAAVADILFGTANPSGRLPVTFYRSLDQLPPFADYDMKGRTYRYFQGEPLYPFGHGLSYTKFDYSDLRVDRPRVRAAGRVAMALNTGAAAAGATTAGSPAVGSATAGSTAAGAASAGSATAGGAPPIEVSVTVKNTGTRAGHEVVQLYVRAPSTNRPMPIRELRGFTRIALEPGAQQRVTFRLTASDALAHYDESAKTFIVDGGDYALEVGASSRDIRIKGQVRVE